MSLLRSVRAELTKLFTTGLWWILALVLVVYLGLTSAGLGFVLGGTAAGILPGQAHAVPVSPSGLAPLLYGIASSVGFVFPLLIGTLTSAGEFRHRTLTATFLAVPRRGLVLGGKAVAGVVVGVVYAILALAATVVPAAGLLAGFGLSTQLGAGDTWAMLARIVLVFALWAVVGVGVGALVRSQVAAIVIVLAFTQFAEPVVRLAATFLRGLQPVADALPGTAGDALVGSGFFALLGSGGTAATPSWWAGGLILLGYAVVLMVLGHALGWRRDVG